MMWECRLSELNRTKNVHLPKDHKILIFILELETSNTFRN